ncbi:hypothetical protein F5Y16DRAFT_358351 [Xylariaceae sp. FL0255]|nr:hypothetical protein F5Y16DRAFT_358351 [Xylariaceae sp. FL0255]
MSSSPEQNAGQQQNINNNLSLSTGGSPAEGGGGGNGRDASVPATSSAPPVKRTRVLLSCHTCRASKLKCDRAKPSCGQCFKKGRPEACEYAPRPERSKPAKTMAARLQRLEGMVRGMIELDGGADSGARGDDPTGNAAMTQPHRIGGSVVHGEKATNYVGGTHFMAILEDLEDLKAYFEDADADGLEPDEYDSLGPSDLLLFQRGAPRNKEELLGLLPDKNVMDRLMNRYFNSNSPSQHIIHIPTFSKQYSAFLKDPQAAEMHWLATLFIILALGVFFSSFIAPHELEIDSPVPAMDRFREYRSACSSALIMGKFAQPGPFTIQALLLYTEAEFLVNRISQTNCYLLCSTLIRLMLKCGLHRDPSKLPSITPFDGEMRRRQWNLAIQIDLLVAFHLGLPCMIHGIESDTALPRNLLDSDFNEDSAELPPSRPMAEYTPLTYAINKARIARGFGLVARLSHSLTLPSYAEVMRVDARIRDVWNSVPSFMMIKPLSECITDSPMLVIQRFGLASLYQKSRCVLHRRYLVDLQRLQEHDFSRRTCLEAAIALLGYQAIMHDACKPGGMLAANGWFLASLVINDFLLADMIVSIAIMQFIANEDGVEWTASCVPAVSKDLLIEKLTRSYAIWKKMGETVHDCHKAAVVVHALLRRIYTQIGMTPEDFASPGGGSSNGGRPASPPLGRLTLGKSSASSGSSHAATISNDGAASTGPSSHSPPDFMDFGNIADPNLSTIVNGGANDLMTGGTGVDLSSQMNVDDPWGISQMQHGYDWSQFDNMARGPTDNIPATQIPQQVPPDQTWLDQNNYNDFTDFVATNSWNQFPQF